MDLQDSERKREHTCQSAIIHKNKFFWEFLRFVILNYYVFQSVLVATFYSTYIITQTTLLPMNIIFLVFLFADVFYKFFITPYPSFNKLSDYNKCWKMFKYYLIKKKLLIDIFVFVLFTCSFIVPYNAASVLRLVIVFRLFEVVTFNEQIYKRIHTNKILRKSYTLLKILYVMILFSHYFGCLFFYMDQVTIDQEYYGPITTKNQLYYQMNMLCYTPIEALDDAGRYLYGLYFLVSLITTIAYGDIVGKNPIQEIYVTIMMIVSTVSIALILEQFMLMVRNDSLGLYEFIKNYNCLKTKMDDGGISRHLQNKVRSYLVYTQYERRFHAHEPIIEKLPKKLRNDLAQQGYSHSLFSIFSSIEIKNIYSLCYICSECTFQAQTQIFDEEQEGRNFQFLYLRSGIVQEYLELSDSKKNLPTHRKYFNFAKLIMNCRLQIDEDDEIYPIYNYNKRKLRCIKLSQFIAIKKENFEEYVGKDQWLLKKMRILREKIIIKETNLSKVGEDCSICMYPNNLDHTCEECPYSHLVFSERIKKAEKMLVILEKENRSKRYERKKTKSTKILNKPHVSAIFRKLSAATSTQEKESGQKVLGLLKNLIQGMEEERREDNVVDSSYDPQGEEGFSLEENM